MILTRSRTDLASLLHNGEVTVALIYGDRDLACNWMGGERVSLSLQQPGFADASYQRIILDDNNSTEVGLVRQLNNLSFSRIFQAGHEVPAYAPEAAYQVFMRVMKHVDIARGVGEPVGDEAGVRSAWEIGSEVLEEVGKVEERCYLLMKELTCEEETWRGVMTGEAVVRDWVVVGRTEDRMGRFDGQKVIG